MEKLLNSGLIELFENQKSGLVWIDRKQNVRYANTQAKKLMGSALGARLCDSALMRAAAETMAGCGPRTVGTPGAIAKSGIGARELQCRVINGLSREDAFILLQDSNATDPADDLDDLMHIIRTDLHVPLQRIEQALCVARDADSDGHSIDTLVNQVGELAQVARNLADLATVWAAGPMRSDDRIELMKLIQQAWAKVQPLAIDRNVKLRFRTPVPGNDLAALYGSELWLHRLFLECLESAVRASRFGSTLEILHRQQGSRATLVFRDCGAFASREMAADTIELQAGKTPYQTKSGSLRPSARERVSLKLCQHIVTMHGGQLREEDEDGLRNFLIELPTGAPHNQQHSQLDMAQAQQYARDLSELLARSRDRAGPGIKNPS